MSMPNKHLAFIFEEHCQYLQTGLQGGYLAFPLLAQLFLLSLILSLWVGGGGGGRRVALSITACQVVLKDKNHRRSPLVQGRLGMS